MKFIFDFDDVLFHNTKQYKKHMYECFEKAGLSYDVANEYYEKVKTNKSWLRDMLNHFSLDETTYEKIVDGSKDCINEELLAIVKKLGRENCYIVTHGDKKFQQDKIRKAGVESLFSEIVIVSDSKKEAIERICARHKDEQVVFIDDRPKHLENLDFNKYPNLQTILYDENGFEKVFSIIPH